MNIRAAGFDCLKPNRHQSISRVQSSFSPDGIWQNHIDGGSCMNDGLMEAAIAGATFAAGAAIWLLAGYLIQRFIFRTRCTKTACAA
jgi:hypothetical protein